MRFTAPRSATAVALALGLAAPAPVVAQEAEAALPECWAEAALPCVTDTGAEVETEAELETWVESFPEEAAAAAQRAAEEADGAEAPATEDGAEADDAAAPEAEAAETGAEATPEADDAEAETGEAAPTEEPAAAETPEAAPEASDQADAPETSPAEAPAEAEAPEAAPEASDQADAPETSPDEAPAEAEAPEAAPEASDQADAPESSPAEAPAAAEAPETAPDASDQADAPDTAPTEDPAAEAAPADEAPAGEAAAADAPSTVEDDIPEVSSAVPPEAPAEGTVDDDIPEVSSEVPPESAEDAGQGMAQTDSTEPPAAAAAATAEADATADVEETVVTEETARSSAEDFGTAIERQETTETSDDSDDRRETLQRALAAGLAGAALAALLDQGGQVTADSGDRLVLQQDDGNLRLFRDENALLRQPGARVRTETFDDGSTRTRVLRDDGTEIVSIRAADGTLLRRTRVLPDGREVLLIDDMEQARPVEVAELPEPSREVVRYTGDEEELRAALARAMSQDVGRSFSLRQIREIDRVRYLAPEIEIDAITFPTGSAAIQPDQAQQLATLGRALASLVEESPGEVFLVEGHTDAVGDASYNLALSDRRAESVALALTEYFDVPPENLVVQGYGEFDLKVPTQTAERENRRANVRRITGLLGIEAADLR